MSEKNRNGYEYISSNARRRPDGLIELAPSGCYGTGDVMFGELEIGKPYIIEKQGEKHILLRRKGGLTQRGVLECIVDEEGVLKMMAWNSGEIEWGNDICYVNYDVLYDREQHKVAMDSFEKLKEVLARIGYKPLGELKPLKLNLKKLKKLPILSNLNT